jgi:hypothetical protein
MLQWSRARSSAEFPARDSHQVGVAIASMEPCSFEHGIEIAIGGGGGSYTELQWSRARSSADYKLVESNLRFGRQASMEPRSFERGIGSPVSI